jgi:hypothetical protein
MRRRLASVAALLLLPIAPAGSPRRSATQPAAVDLKPVTVAVVDRDSGEPVKAFTYQAYYDAPGRASRRVDDGWTRVASATGTFEIQAPLACRLHVIAKAPDYIGGYPLVEEFAIKSADNPRRVVVRLRRGITVSGTIRDAKTKVPIAGVRVAPLIQQPPGWHPDEDKEVKTGADGRFEVRGVDPARGVSTSHPDYVRDDPPGGEPIGPNHDIFLKRGLTITVTVVDPDGKPLHGAAALDLNEKWAVSGADGRLVVRAPEERPRLFVFKDGFIDRTIEFDEIRRESSKPKGLVVVMEPLIALKGQVTAPDGRPVTAFKVAAGPSELPWLGESNARDVQDRDGRFSLGLSKAGKTWVGVAADGFAPWEGWADFKRGGEPLEIRLAPGVEVSGRVAVPDALRKSVKTKLVPRRDESEVGWHQADARTAEVPTRTATLSADGTLRLDNVRPDRYRLSIQGPGVPETVLAIDVPASGLEIGTVRIDFPTATGRAQGRVEGRVWHPKDKGGGPWAFARGSVGGFRFEGLGESGIAFQADEFGHFRVDDVPAGLTTVEFPYLTYDVIQSYTWSALVVEGQMTDVRAFDPDGHREFTLNFAIGDGSKAQYESGTGLGAARKVDGVTASPKILSIFSEAPVTPRQPMFRVDLVPLSKGPLSFAKPDWEELDAQRKIVLPDVGPGKYRLRLCDWLGMRDFDSGPLFDEEVIVPVGGHGVVRVELGAGCVTGKITMRTESFLRPTEVTAVMKGSQTPSRWSRCDSDGNFCVRYLSPGTYSLLIHDANTGFCRVDDLKVGAHVIEVGERKLSAEATIDGVIQFVRPSPVPNEIVAIHDSGDAVRVAFEHRSSFDRFKLAGIWPGHWTVSARKGDQVLASSELNVERAGTMRVTLVVGGRPNP